MTLISFNWYVVHTKPRQEKRALANLEQQGYECFLPLLRANKIKQRKLIEIDEIMFSRYIFIRLSKDQWAKSWYPIRSTIGVTSLLMFGDEPQKVSDVIIDTIRNTAAKRTVKKIFNGGDHIIVCEGALRGVEGIYQIENGKDRAMSLIELLSNPILLKIPMNQIKKISS